MNQEDYPTNFEEFLERFQSEEDCQEYITKIRWPDGFTCPKCRSPNAWKTDRRLRHCSVCGHQASITAGTLFQDTRKPLRLWFHVMWMVVSQKTGASAKNLNDMMGFGSYQTIWAWLDKFRRAMIRPGRDKLKKLVEIDETFLGAKEKGAKGRTPGKKVLIVVAVEILDAKKPLGRVRFRCIPNASGDFLTPFIRENVESGSAIITDGWKGYESLEKSGYNHVKKKIKGSGKEASDLLPHVHLIVTLVKRWLRGTHQGGVSVNHLPYYLDEYAFRFNRRLSTHRGKLFYRLMQQVVATKPEPTKKLYISTKTKEPQDVVVT